MKGTKSRKDRVTCRFHQLLLPFFLKSFANSTALDELYADTVDWEAPVADVGEVVPG